MDDDEFVFPVELIVMLSQNKLLTIMGNSKCLLFQ